MASEAKASTSSRRRSGVDWRRWVTSHTRPSQPLALPADYVLMAMDIGALEGEDVEADPRDPRGLGDAWLSSLRSAVLRVPSAIVPESRNLLLNVAHPDAGKARIASVRAFAFDERPWSGG